MTAQGPRAQPPAVYADQEVLRFGASLVPDDGVLEVSFDGRRVWSFDADAVADADDGLSEIDWPAPLQSYLDGVAVVAVRRHGDPAPLAEAEVSFGEGKGRVLLVDRHGRALSMHKWGKLGETFDDLESSAKEEYLDQVEVVLDILRRHCHRDAFISFGTLLGAVRSGRLIGHDVDVDLGYLSLFQVPVDVVRESFVIERALREATGWRTVRANGGFLQLFPPQRDGSVRNIDVFSAFATPGGQRVYQVNDIGTDGDRSIFVPVQPMALEGRTLPAPARPDVLLAAAYGEGWRVPDPSFRYRANPTRRRIRMWVGGWREERDRWTRFYRDNPGKPPAPSEFVRWLSPQLVDETVIDVGCGRGQDVRFLAGQGRRSIGLDVVPAAFRRIRRQARRLGRPAAFRSLNLGSLHETLWAGASAARLPGRRTVMSRFMLHTLSPASRANFWRLCSMALYDGGRCYIEVPQYPHDVGSCGAASPTTWHIDDLVADAGRFDARVIARHDVRSRAPFGTDEIDAIRLVLEFPDSSRPATPWRET